MSDAQEPVGAGVELPDDEEDAATEEGSDPYEGLTIPKGAVAEPGTSLVNETGSWRETKPLIHHEPCTGCGLCATFCPDMAIKRIDDMDDPIGGIPADRRPVPRSAKHVGEQQIAVDYRYCKGCGICETECPIDAIDMVPEVK